MTHDASITNGTGGVSFVTHNLAITNNSGGFTYSGNSVPSGTTTVSGNS